jgi:organic radical activating enzyme
MSKVYVSEVFSSLQGEGMNAGQPALFLRLSGCNLACTYCDTSYAREHQPMMTLHRDDARQEYANPVDCKDLVSLVHRHFSNLSTVVVTGGEPLLQAGAVREISGDMRMLGYRLHLETNGTLPGELAGVKDLLDFVSMDVKLPSSQRGRLLWSEHASFLHVIEGCNVAAKVVVTEDVKPSEIARAADLIADANPLLTTFIQPAYRDGVPTVDGQTLLRYCALARRRIEDVRISVQIHKILGIR